MGRRPAKYSPACEPELWAGASRCLFASLEAARVSRNRGKVAMTSFKHEDGSWEPSDNRVIRVGRVIYWLATSVAVLMVIFIIGDLYISWAQDRPILRVFALLIALLVWLIGRACRSLSGNPPLTR